MNSNQERFYRTVLTSVRIDVAVDEDVLNITTAALRTALAFDCPLSDDEFEEVMRDLHRVLAIRLGESSFLDSHTWKPWLDEKKASIQFRYWKRYAHYLRSDVKPLPLPPEVVNGIDRVTDQILDRVGDPKQLALNRRGLVVGSVQSGKTATYTGLICKAADVGYKCIILLTGTLELLRRQTQVRLDEGFIGFDSSAFLDEKKNHKVGVGIHATDPDLVSPATFTSKTTDFNRQGLGFTLNSINGAALFVVKKNKKRLQGLREWLEAQNAINGKIDHPLLLIDDEADNASVNTRSRETPTEINKEIRAILRLFTRKSYVGVTATPFANIFIDPDASETSVDGDLPISDDLFPEDYIVALTPPENYFGPTTLFGQEQVSRNIKPIVDADGFIPFGAKKYDQITSLPNSLIEAVDCFFLANTVRDLRGSVRSHRSMLVNVSLLNFQQAQVFKLLEGETYALKDEIGLHHAKPLPQAIKSSPRLERLHKAWEANYASESEFAWPTIQAKLNESVQRISVCLVNQAGSRLDYSKHPSGYRVIAVGGNSLSRGLTVEDLVISYFYRNSRMYDTLMQMGRWFGYRDGYSDLCRIWMHPDSIDHFTRITRAIEELRRSLNQMIDDGLTPALFGLRVRNHPDTVLMVTAQNKMKSAREVTVDMVLSSKLVESTHLWADARRNQDNFALLKSFIVDVLGDPTEFLARRQGKERNPIWRDIDKQKIASLIEAFRSHSLNPHFNGPAISNMLRGSSEGKLDKWQVVIPYGVSAHTSTIGKLDVSWEERQLVYKAARNEVRFTNSRVGAGNVSRLGMSPDELATAEKVAQEDTRRQSVAIIDADYCRVRSHPALQIHFVKPSLTGTSDVSAPGFLVDDDSPIPLCAIGISFPEFSESKPENRASYVINAVEWKKNYLPPDASDDEVVTANGSDEDDED